MDKNKCTSCGKPKCSCKNKDFTKAVIEIDNPEQITLMRKVTIPASMGDDTTVPPVVGKYHNVLLYYEANQKSYLYSSDGIPTLLANGITDYEQAANLPEINGHTLLGNKTGEDLGLQNTLSVTADTGIQLENDELSGLPATDTAIGMVKPGTGLAVTSDGTINATISDYSTSEVNTNATWIDGSPIYKKTIDTGALPNTAIKTISAGIGSHVVKKVIKLEGLAYDPILYLSLELGDHDSHLAYSPDSIEIRTYYDATNFTSSYVTIYYTKN